MPRRKVPMRLIESARARAETHARRTKGLQKKASELATLCAVPVALVCAGAGAPPLVWESEEGVLERYRRAVPAETRARHTHRSFMETELGKERAKLARARHGCPGALADWDAALNDMTLEEARGLLETIDAALLATEDRMEALGIPVDGGHGPLEGSSEDAVMPQQLGHGDGNPVDMDAAGFQQLQMVSFHVGNNDGLLEQFSWDDPFQTQQGCGGFQCVGGNYSECGDKMLSPGLTNADYNYSECGDKMLSPGLTNADYNYSECGDKMLSPGLTNADYNYSECGDKMLSPGLTNADYNYSEGGDKMLSPGLTNANYNYSDGGDKMLSPGLTNADYNYSEGGDKMLSPGLTNANYNYSDGGDMMLSPGLTNADYNYSAGGDEMLAPGLANADYNYSAGGDEMLALSLANADYNYSGGGDEMLAPGFANADCNYSDGGDEMLAPGFGNADYDWTDLSIWATDKLCDAVMPLGCYTDFADGTLPPDYSAQVVTGGDYVNTPPSGWYGHPMAMGVGDNFTSLDSNYTAHWQFQRFDTSSLLLGEMRS